eukprot:512572-Alexandrium_andersonii.AAC.1
MRPRLPEDADQAGTDAVAASLSSYWQAQGDLPRALALLARSHPDAAWESWCGHVERSLIAAGLVERRAERCLGKPVALVPAQATRRGRQSLQERRLRRQLRRAQTAAADAAAGRPVQENLKRKLHQVDRELPLTPEQRASLSLSLIHISEPTRLALI